MQNQDKVNQYDQRNIETMETVYGRGYLSAGGDEEVAKVLEQFDLQGKRILDLGCGLGGASVTMVRDLGATEVVGYDIDDEVLSRAKALIDDNRVGKQVSLVKGNPGPLEFCNDSFDLAYTAAVTCHMEDLSGFLNEVVRVIKPGGWLAGSDWMIRETNDAYHVWDDMLRERGLNFYFVDPTRFKKSLVSSGLSKVTLTDRTEAFTGFAAVSRERVEGEFKPVLRSSLGEHGYRAFSNWTRVRYGGLNDGAMWYQHFRGQKTKQEAGI
jgi:ubiquinone/menaquinone biosynthesis C-methylase UbiE